MDIETLYGQISARLPEDRRSVMELMANLKWDHNASAPCLVAGANQRERQILRLLMTDIEKMEALKDNENQ